MVLTDKIAITLPKDLLRSLEGLREKTGESRSAAIKRAIGLMLHEETRVQRMKEQVANYAKQKDDDQIIPGKIATNDMFVDRINGQIDGFWFGPSEQIPAEMPDYFPTGAVLHGSPFPADEGGVCLDLVAVDHIWCPMSEAGSDTYSHSHGLARDEIWHLVVVGHAWPTTFRAKVHSAISPDGVLAIYGKEAFDRTLPDRSSLQLKLTRV